MAASFGFYLPPKAHQDYGLEVLSQAKNGNTVKVHYTGKLENGTAFHTSKDRQPLEFTIGSGRIMPGLKRASSVWKSGTQKTITVPPEGAYGPRRKELVVDTKKTDLPEDIAPAMGTRLRIRQKDGNPIEITIRDMDEDTVALDPNHPLAGNTLVFEVELVEIAQLTKVLQTLVVRERVFIYAVLINCAKTTQCIIRLGPEPKLVLDSLNQFFENLEVMVMCAETPC